MTQPGVNVIFAAFGGMLAVSREPSCGVTSRLIGAIQATKGVSKRYDALMDLFEEVPFFIDSARYQESNPRSWGDASQNITVAIFVHILDVFAIALKLMKTAFGGTVFARLGGDGCFAFTVCSVLTELTLAHYGKSLVGESDMQDALGRLRRLTELHSRALVTETRADAAENLEVTNALLGNLVAMDLGAS